MFYTTAMAKRCVRQLADVRFGMLVIAAVFCVNVCLSTAVAQADEPAAPSQQADARTHVQIKKVDYQHGDVKLQGVLAVSDARDWEDRHAPAVLIIHEWWGLDNYAIMRAKKLAAMGYIAFALDMYGQGKHSDKIEDAKAWSSQFYGKPLMAQRAQAGLDVLLKQPGVDPNNIIVIGYCFGGTTAIELAYSGANLKGAVSFHGAPAIPTKEQAKATKANLLILTGASDPMFDAAKRKAFVESIGKTDINWSMVLYSKAQHSFTNPGADQHNMPGVAYNKQADIQSWQALVTYMGYVFNEGR